MRDRGCRVRLTENNSRLEVLFAEIAIDLLQARFEGLSDLRVCASNAITSGLPYHP